MRVSLLILYIQLILPCRGVAEGEDRSANSLAHSITGTVTRVSDGDSVIVAPLATPCPTAFPCSRNCGVAHYPRPLRVRGGVGPR